MDWDYERDIYWIIYRNGKNKHGRIKLLMDFFAETRPDAERRYNDKYMKFEDKVKARMK